MPITKSAKKALRSSERKRVFNLRSKSKIVEAKRVLNKILGVESEKIDKKLIPEALSNYFSALDKAVKTDYVHKNTASRLKSRMQLKISKLLGEYKPEFAEIALKKKSEEKPKKIADKAVKKEKPTKTKEVVNTTKKAPKKEVKSKS